MLTTIANHVLTLSRLLQACMHLHHDTRPGLWHAAFGFGAGFGARAGLGEQRQFTPCCLVALSPVLCGTLDAPRRQPLSLAVTSYIMLLALVQRYSHLAFAVSANTILSHIAKRRTSIGHQLAVLQGSVNTTLRAPVGRALVYLQTACS